MKAIVNVIILLSSVSSALCQEGHVEIYKDQRIDGLVKKQGLIIPPATSPQMPGYRVQLIFDSDRKVVDEARNRFIASYPKVDTYVIYNAPNYVLKVGDFRSQLEAEKVKNSFVRDFPTCFIIKEMINLPRIDQD
jgi:hypothetical protein